MDKNRKTSHILNVFQYDADGHVVLPASLTLSIAPGAADNNSKVPTTAWVRTYVSGLSYQGAITLTTSGTSGAATLVGNTLNIPTYTLAGLGGQPALSGTGFVKISGTTISYDNNTYATETYVGTQIANLVDSSPATLDTLNELAAALGDDPNFATTVATSIGTKQAQLNGTGFVKVSGTTVSYDNSTYLTTSSAASTYQTILTNPITGTGTTQTLAKFTSTGSTIGNSNIVLSSGANYVEMTVGSTSGSVNNYNTLSLLAVTEPRIYLTASDGFNSVLFNSYGNIGFQAQFSNPSVNNFIFYYNGYSSTNKSLVFQTSGLDRLTLNQNGSVRLNNYTTNGFVKFSDSDGTLIVDTNTYLTTSSASSTYLPLAGGTLTGPVISSTFTVKGTSIGAGLGKLSVYAGGDENTWNATRNEAIRIGRADVDGSFYHSIWSATGSGVDETAHWLRFYISNADGVSQTLAMTMNGNGNVGIGNINPGYKLDVSGTARFTGALTGTSASFSSTLSDYVMTLSNVQDSSQGLLVRATDNDSNLYLLTLQSSGGAVSQTWVDRFTVAKNGAAFFSNTIDANGSISTLAGLNTSKNIIAGEATPLHLSYSTSDGNGPAVRFGSGQGFWDIQPSNNNQRITFEWSDSVNALSLLSSGNVGIGTINPSTKLTLSRATETTASQLELRSVGGISDGNYDGIKFTQSSDGSTPLGSIRLKYKSDGYPDFGIFTRSGDLVETERVTILNNGNVGIGTQSPSSLLHIIGSSETLYLGRVNGSSPHVRLQSSNGSVASRTISSNGNRVGQISFEPYNGSAYTEQTGIFGVINGTVSTGSIPVDLVFAAGSSGQIADTEKMRIRAGGGISITGSTSYISMDGPGLAGPPSGLAYGLYPHGGIGLGYYSVATGHVWYVTASPVSRMYLTSNNLFVGPQQSTTYSERLNVAGGIRIHTGNEWDGVGITATGTRVFYDHTGAEDDVQFQFFSSTRFTLYSNGNYAFTGSNVSDARLKNSISSVTTSYIDKINQLELSTFKMNSETNGSFKMGFIAQQVKTILPEVVTGDETKEHEYLGVDTNGLLAIAIKAIQELKAENDTLKNILKSNNII